MTAIVTTVQVARPAADVFNYATDATCFGEWQQGVVSGNMKHTGPSPQVGDICSMTRRIGGADRVSTSRLDHCDPPRTWGVRGLDGPIRASVDVTAESVTESPTRLTISVDFAGHGIGKLLVPLVVRRQARKEMPANLAALKQRLETSAAAS